MATLNRSELGPYCPYYAAAVEMIARRWVPLILRAFLTGPQRFSDLAAAIPGMTDAMLSRRLKDLEADGLVERVVQPTTPVRIDYRLTDKGESLSDILLALNRWAVENVTLPDS
ncbi:winged helix-turn-helix transcriptional regulator [Nocardia sp. IFM 10818]